MSSGQAMRMQLELSHLAKRHRIMPPEPFELPLASPTDYPVDIVGHAVTNSIDQERMRFRPWSLAFLPWKPPPLLYRHKEPAGEITEIWHDARGRLIINARVDHPEARRCQGLSVAATVKRYELRDVDSPENFHALISAADLDEISLTPTPACSDCVVTSRLRISATNAYFAELKRGVEKAIEIVEALRTLSREQAEAVVGSVPTTKSSSQFVCGVSAPRIYGPYPARNFRARSPTPFAALVSQLPKGEVHL